MATFTVSWIIDVEANSAREAVEQALAIQRDPESTATVFTAHLLTPGGQTASEVIDLLAEED